MSKNKSDSLSLPNLHRDFSEVARWHKQISELTRLRDDLDRQIAEARDLRKSQARRETEIDRLLNAESPAVALADVQAVPDLHQLHAQRDRIDEALRQASNIELPAAISEASRVVCASSAVKTVTRDIAQRQLDALRTLVQCNQAKAQLRSALVAAGFDWAHLALPIVWVPGQGEDDPFVALAERVEQYLQECK